MTHKCHWYYASREQRKHEFERGLDRSGTQSFEDRGCYDCNGYNNECESYQQSVERNQQSVERRGTHSGEEI